MSKKTKIYNGHYEKISKIGEGTYGKVMIVQDLKDKMVPIQQKNNIIEFEENKNQESQKPPTIFAIKKSKTEKNQNLQVFLPK